MSLAKYEAFLRIVDMGSLSAAAAALGYTQSAVSHMLLSLEKELGLRLITRSRAGVHLTDAGERLLPVVRTLLADNEQLGQTVAALHGLDAGTVRIGAFTSVAVHWLPGIIKSFQQEYPRIEFKLMNGDYFDVENWLYGHEVDLGFVRMPFDGAYLCTPLVEDRLLAILPRGHRLAKEKRFPIRQAAYEPFISLPESSAQDTRMALEAAGVKPNIKFYTKDDYAIIAMVANGLGMSIVPELLRPLERPCRTRAGYSGQPDDRPCHARHRQRWSGHGQVCRPCVRMDSRARCQPALRRNVQPAGNGIEGTFRRQTNRGAAHFRARGFAKRMAANRCMGSRQGDPSNAGSRTYSALSSNACSAFARDGAWGCGRKRRSRRLAPETNRNRAG